MSIPIKIVDHTVCEIDSLRKGYISCADQMLKERIAIMDRLWAMNCLIASGADSDITSYLYEQIKELATKLIITT